MTNWAQDNDAELRAAELSIVTTEHFALQSARSATIAESTGRATVFLGAVSGGLVALGLIATATRVGHAFTAFGLVLLPTLSFLGLVTFERVLQSGIEDHYYARRIAQLRSYYFDHPAMLAGRRDEQQIQRASANAQPRQQGAPLRGCGTRHSERAARPSPFWRQSAEDRRGRNERAARAVAEAYAADRGTGRAGRPSWLDQLRALERPRPHHPTARPQGAGSITAAGFLAAVLARTAAQPRPTVH